VRSLLFCVVAAYGLVACSHLPTSPAGKVEDKPGLSDAQALVWQAAYGRTDASPLVYLVTGDALNCTSPVTGAAGFQCWPTGCREGCTSQPLAVHVAFADGTPWSQTTLAHEDMHAKKIRVALAGALESPTEAALLIYADRDHGGPEWQPGGAVDLANAMLAGHGL
jgi:hypothetical protein